MVCHPVVLAIGGGMVAAGVPRGGKAEPHLPLLWVMAGSAVCRLNLPWGPRAPSSGNGDVRGPTSQRNI